MYNDYYSSQRRDANKSWVIAILVLIVAALLGVILNLKSAYDLHEYAKANDCNWVWQGTHYGDDRDYICK